MIAKLIHPEHDYWVGDARIYQLDPPLQGFDHVAVTVHPVAYGQWQNAGAEVVGCDGNGHIPGDSVVAIHQDYVVKTHEQVLGDLGYSVTP